MAYTLPFIVEFVCKVPDKMIKFTDNGSDFMTATDAPNRQYKDSTFRMLFTIKKNAADLYYGLTGITAAENDIVMDEIGGLLTSQLNHDVSFRIGNKLIFLVEHQSTLNENMPVRLLIGIAELFNRYIRSIDEKAIYLKKLIKLPSPEFYVLYNGKYDAPQQQIMKLSDAFGENDKGNLELKATFINIKCEENAPLLQRSQVLREYSRLVYYVEKGRKEGLTLKPAIKNAIEKCLKENILCEFLRHHQFVWRNPQPVKQLHIPMAALHQCQSSGA